MDTIVQARADMIATLKSFRYSGGSGHRAWRHRRGVGASGPGGETASGVSALLIKPTIALSQVSRPRRARRASPRRSADGRGRRGRSRSPAMTFSRPTSLGEAHDAVGHQLRMLQHVGGVADHAGDEDLAVRQLGVLPDLPFVLVAHVAGLDRVGLRLHLEQQVDHVLQRRRRRCAGRASSPSRCGSGRDPRGCPAARGSPPRPGTPPTCDSRRCRRSSRTTSRRCRPAPGRRSAGRSRHRRWPCIPRGSPRPAPRCSPPRSCSSALRRICSVAGDTAVMNASSTRLARTAAAEVVDVALDGGVADVLHRSGAGEAVEARGAGAACCAALAAALASAA